MKKNQIITATLANNNKQEIGLVTFRVTANHNGCIEAYYAVSTLINVNEIEKGDIEAAWNRTTGGMNTELFNAEGHQFGDNQSVDVGTLTSCCF